LRLEEESREHILQGKQFQVHNGEPERRPTAACTQFFTVCFYCDSCDVVAANKHVKPAADIFLATEKKGVALRGIENKITNER
jgi:hypothetical protein